MYNFKIQKIIGHYNKFTSLQLLWNEIIGPRDLLHTLNVCRMCRVNCASNVTNLIIKRCKMKYNENTFSKMSIETNMGVSLGT